jgi:hypothetical protein
LNPSRRRILFAGISGAAALAAIRWLQPSPAVRVMAEPGLTADGEDVMRALIPAFLDGALPDARGPRHVAIDATVAAVAEAIRGLPPIARGELGALFALLAFAPVRVALAGVSGSWRTADVADANAFLERLRASRWPQKRAIYDALHQLTFAAWYANPAAWPAIGYPGPPRLT